MQSSRARSARSTARSTETPACAHWSTDSMHAGCVGALGVWVLERVVAWAAWVYRPVHGCMGAASPWVH
eukprot:7315293-Alexandrium_andersonii.AAC.1